MIKFKKPRISKIHSGHISIELTEEGIWEFFTAFAIAYSKQIGAVLKKEIVGPDVRFWDLIFRKAELR